MLPAPPYDTMLKLVSALHGGTADSKVRFVLMNSFSTSDDTKAYLRSAHGGGFSQPTAACLFATPLPTPFITRIASLRQHCPSLSHVARIAPVLSAAVAFLACCHVFFPTSCLYPPPPYHHTQTCWTSPTWSWFRT